jgi:hypothetical protein
MRVPKRNAGLITKALRLGIFAKGGPREWARINREKKIGFFDPEVQAKGGRIGGASRSPAKIEANRRQIRELNTDLVFREMQRWMNTPYSAWTHNPEKLSETRKLAAHTRWHTNRGKPNPACPLCRAGSDVKLGIDNL